jgi:hypothetical protein
MTGKSPEFGHDSDESHDSIPLMSGNPSEPVSRDQSALEDATKK